MLTDNNMKHGPIRSFGGSCSYTQYITDIMNISDVTYLSLMLSDTDFRTLKPNEYYYKWYDDEDN